MPAPVPVEIMARAWHDIVREDADAPSLQAALRSLVRPLTSCEWKVPTRKTEGLRMLDVTTRLDADASSMQAAHRSLVREPTTYRTVALRSTFGLCTGLVRQGGELGICLIVRPFCFGSDIQRYVLARWRQRTGTQSSYRRGWRLCWVLVVQTFNDHLFRTSAKVAAAHGCLKVLSNDLATVWHFIQNYIQHVVCARWRRRAATRSCCPRTWRRASRLCWTARVRSTRWSL